MKQAPRYVQQLNGELRRVPPKQRGKKFRKWFKRYRQQDAARKDGQLGPRGRTKFA